LTGDLDAQGNYAIDLQNFSDMIAGKGPGYWFDGSNDYIQSPLTMPTLSTDDISILFSFSAYDVTTEQTLFQHRTSTTNRIVAQIYNGSLRIGVNDGSSYNISGSISANKNYVGCCVWDSSGNNLYLYLNGELQSGSDSIQHSVDSSNVTIGADDSTPTYPFYGDIQVFQYFNLAIASGEIKTLSNDIRILYKYKGANQTEQTSGTLTIGKKYRIKNWITDDDFTNVGGTNEDGNEFVATGTTPTTWTNSSVLVQVGCILNHNHSGIGHNIWQDASGNKLHGTVSGALPFNLPANHSEKYIDLNVTGNTSFTLPQGYQIKSILAIETAGNALTGGLDVGLTTNGTEIVSGMAIGANAVVPCTLVASGTVGGTFTTADDTIYISDGDDDGNWNSAELEIRVVMDKISID
jgi:hypothetical protein